MAVSDHDREVLRDLGEQVAEIAALPVQQEKIRLWKALNGLAASRPMVTIDQVCWHEMDVDGELTLQSADRFCRTIETRLRRTLYAWRHMPVDMVVEPVIEIPKTIRGLGYGIRTQEKTAAVDPENDVVGHYYLDQLKTEDDLEKIKTTQEALKQATYKVSEAMYKGQEQAAPGGDTPDAEAKDGTADAASADGDDVVDAEFEVN